MLPAVTPDHDGPVAVAAYGLHGIHSTLPSAPLPQPEWRALLAQVRRHRLQGHLASAVSGKAFPVTAEQADEVADLHAEAVAQVLLLERALLDCVEVLDAAGIASRTLKGAACAHLDYGDPAVRLYGDVDLLVPSAAFDEAVAVLGDAGFRRRSAEIRPGFDRRFGKGTTLVHGGGLEVDLHRTFVMGPFGLGVDLEALFASEASYVLGGRRLRALAAEERFLHTCYNAALGDVPARLAPLRDVAQVVLAGRFDADRALALARAWRGEAVVARAVRLAWQRFGLADAVPLTAWATRYVPSRAEERALAVYERGTRYSRKALASLAVINGIAAKTAFAGALLLPQRDFLTGQGRTRTEWARRCTQRLLRQEPRA